MCCQGKDYLKVTHPIFQDNKTEIKRGEVFYSRSTIYLLVAHISEFSLSVTDGVVHFEKHCFVILKSVDCESLTMLSRQDGKIKDVKQGQRKKKSMRGKRREYCILKKGGGRGDAEKQKKICPQDMIVLSSMAKSIENKIFLSFGSKIP